MTDTLITHLQLFGIGVSFGLIGPCFFTCAPILIAYLTGRGKSPRDSLVDVILFLTGRLAAYGLLGALAGMSGRTLQHLTGGHFLAVSRIAAGVISAGLAVFVLRGRVEGGRRCCAEGKGAAASGGLLALGFVLGIAPCAPLAALLFEILLMSRSACEGFGYAFSFGLGTFIAGFLVVGSVAGLFAWLPSRFLQAASLRKGLRIICALLLVLLGGVFIRQGLAAL